MKLREKILIILGFVYCFLCGNVFSQSNARFTPKDNASGAVKKRTVTKKSTTTNNNNSTAPIKKDPSSATKGQVTTTKPATAKAKTNTRDVKPVPVKSSTVTVIKATNTKVYDYRNAIGVRAGQTGGITFKHFISGNEAIEGIVGLWPNAISFTGLYEKYVPSENVDGFRWYFGGGAHASFSTGRLYKVYHEGRYISYRSAYPGVGVGIDVIAGAEYKIPVAPIAISFDIKPFIEVNGSGVIFTAFDPGLGIKFTF